MWLHESIGDIFHIPILYPLTIFDKYLITINLLQDNFSLTICTVEHAESSCADFFAVKLCYNPLANHPLLRYSVMIHAATTTFLRFIFIIHPLNHTTSLDISQD